jgi:hypothetical protein
MHMHAACTTHSDAQGGGQQPETARGTKQRYSYHQEPAAGAAAAPDRATALLACAFAFNESLIPKEAATAHHMQCQPQAASRVSQCGTWSPWQPHTAALCDSVAAARLHTAADCITVLAPEILLKLLLPQIASAAAATQACSCSAAVTATAAVRTNAAVMLAVGARERREMLSVWLYTW